MIIMAAACDKNREHLTSTNTRIRMPDLDLKKEKNVLEHIKQILFAILKEDSS